MNIKGDDYKIVQYQDSVISISGKLSLMPEEYEEIAQFFKKILESAHKEITLDIKELAYLNSSGIKAVCVDLILQAAEIKYLKMKILCSEEYTWQKETVPTFEDLMDDLEIVFEKKQERTGNGNE
ncbi:MAG: hypothetical protein GY749_42160 [Desulfobacteraceae bacterium]|nr:hypothetical protein [Desulfobacteraceae bacterium]